MSIRGSRIYPERPQNDHRVCNRCGVEWRDSRGRFLPEAPCQSCRDVLTDLDGIPRSYWVREKDLTDYDRKTLAAWLKAQNVDERDRISA